MNIYTSVGYANVQAAYQPMATAATQSAVQATAQAAQLAAERPSAPPPAPPEPSLGENATGGQTPGRGSQADAQALITALATPDLPFGAPDDAGAETAAEAGRAAELVAQAAFDAAEGQDRATAIRDTADLVEERFVQGLLDDRTVENRLIEGRILDDVAASEQAFEDRRQTDPLARVGVDLGPGLAPGGLLPADPGTAAPVAPGEGGGLTTPPAFAPDAGAAAGAQAPVAGIEADGVALDPTGEETRLTEAEISPELMPASTTPEPAASAGAGGAPGASVTGAATGGTAAALPPDAATSMYESLFNSTGLDEIVRSERDQQVSDQQRLAQFNSLLAEISGEDAFA